MDRWQRRRVAYVLGVLGLIAAFTLAYNWGVGAFEGESQPLYRSFQFVVETFTATGYGSESPWMSPEMNLLVVVMDVMGVAIVFLALPVLLYPLFERALSTSPPTAVENLTDHVVICSYSPRSETLVEELDRRDVPYVVVEADRDRAVDLYESDRRVIHADPQSVEGLRNANLAGARALVADDDDQVNTSILLTAAEVAGAVRTISVVNDPDRARYHRLAGADEVLSPRELLGESLAAKVTADVATDLGEAVEVGEDFEIAELLVHRGSDLAGATLADSGIRERTGANVVGAWFDGRFESPPPPSATLDGGTILLATGHSEQIERLRDLTESDVRRVGRGRTLVAGYGEVGTSAAAALDDAGVPYTVLDAVDKPGVDVLGDATEPEDLRAAGVEQARTVLLALGDDTTTEVATLVARDLAPEVEIVARAEATENVQKTYRAGADYVLSLATVTGRMLASAVMEAETVVSPDTQVEVVRTRASGLVGQTLGEARVRSKTGCTVVAVERDGEVHTELGPDYRVRADDELIVAGTDEGIERFAREFE